MKRHSDPKFTLNTLFGAVLLWVEAVVGGKVCALRGSPAQAVAW